MPRIVQAAGGPHAPTPERVPGAARPCMHDGLAPLPGPPPSPALACGDLLISTHRLRAPRPLAAGLATHEVALAVGLDGVTWARMAGRLDRLGPGEAMVLSADAEVHAGASGESRVLRALLAPSPVPDPAPAPRGAARVPRNAAAPARTPPKDWSVHLGCRLTTACPVASALFDLLRFLASHAEALHPRVRRQMARAAVDLLAAALPAGPRTAPGPERLPVAQHLRRRVERYALEHLDEPGLTVERIARDLRVSRRYLHKLFEGEGPGLMAWVRDQRLHACRAEIVARGERTIGEVAYAWGFRSPAHFSRAFRARFGIAPSEA